MSFTPILVTRQYTPQGSATPAAGTVRFTLSTTLDNNGTPIYPQPLIANLDNTGAIEITLYANNDIGTLPANSYYNVTENINGQKSRNYQVVIPYTATGGTVQLNSLPPIASTALAGFIPFPNIPPTGYALTWNGSAWVGAEISSGGGDVSSVFGRTGIVVAQSGDYNASQVGALPNNSDLSSIAAATPTAANWSNNGKKITNLANGSSAQDAVTFSQLPTSLPPSGVAGGDLGGTFPDPSVEKIYGNAVANAAPTNGEALVWNGTSYTPTPVMLVSVYDPLGVDDQLVDTGTVQSLTNKQIVYRVLPITNQAAPTIDTDTCDIVSITGQAQAITSMTTNLSGTPFFGQTIEFQITDNGTSQAITWGNKFSSTATCSLPVATTPSTMMRLLFQWNYANGWWDCISAPLTTLVGVRIQKRVSSVAWSATPAINTDAIDVVNMSTVTGAITSMSTNLTGTPNDGDRFELRMIDNGTTHAITWGAKFSAVSGIALPSTTTTSDLMIMEFEWVSSTGLWQITRSTYTGAPPAATPYSIGTGDNGSGTTIVLSVANTTNAGDAIVVGGSYNITGHNEVTGVTDTKGNTYTLAVEQDTNYSQAIFVAQNTTSLVAGTDTITVTFNLSNDKNAWAVGVPGALTSGAVDKTASSSGTSTTPGAGPTATLSQTNEVVIAVVDYATAGGTISWGGGFTEIISPFQYLSNQKSSVAYLLTSATTAVSSTATITSVNWGALLVTIKL